MLHSVIHTTQEENINKNHAGGTNVTFKSFYSSNMLQEAPLAAPPKNSSIQDL